MNKREIYPNAPLVSVSFELRHPEAETLSGKERSLFKELIRRHLPVMRTQQSTTQTIDLGPSGPVQRVITEEVPKYFDRENTVVASLQKNSIIVETSQYPGWEKFRELVRAVCLARHEVANIDGIERIGLRYIDEIRVPGTDVPEWETYLHPSLLGPKSTGKIGLNLKQWQGVAAFGPEEGRSLVLRYASGEGFATDPNGELRRNSPSYPGPFFLLDIDSFWLPESGVPEFSESLLASQGARLHAPVGEIFEHMITDSLRNEVFRK